MKMEHKHAIGTQCAYELWQAYFQYNLETLWAGWVGCPVQGKAAPAVPNIRVCPIEEEEFNE